MKTVTKPPFDAPVDFLIVTALELELDAVIAQFDAPMEFYPREELRPSYCATVPADGGGRYRVVAMSVFGMGNTDAALAAADMIKRWKPGTVLMVGIAAGMPNKKGIKLGDVLISEYVFDYESAKLTPDGPEHRSRQLPADQTLLHRARAYKRSDWHGRVNVSRPGRKRTDVGIDVHFGPLASGEKVIADEEAMRDLLSRCPKLIGAEMESSGVARAALQQVNPSRFLAVRSVSDLGDKDKGDDWQPYAAAVAAAFAVGFLHYGPLEPLAAGAGHANGDVKTRLIIAQSMRRISSAEVIPALQNGGLKKIEAVSIDLTEFAPQGVLRDPQKAVDRLLAPDGQFIGAFTSRRHAELAFCGHAHIPLVVLMGHLVTDRRSVRLLDYDPRPGAETWIWPGPGEEFKPLRRSDSETGVPVSDRSEVIIRVAVSYPADREAARAAVPGATHEIELCHPGPERSIVRSEEQVDEYATTFRGMLDSLESLSPRAKGVHLFYAGPMALAFRIGQQISPSMHPPVTVWNYRAGRYEWGIDLEAVRDGLPAIVRGEN
jgi:nucleoside phosphorylase